MGGNRHISALLSESSGPAGFGGEIFKRGRLCKKPPLKLSSLVTFLFSDKKVTLPYAGKRSFTAKIVHKIVYIFLYNCAIIPENGFLYPSEQYEGAF